MSRMDAQAGFARWMTDSGLEVRDDDGLISQQPGSH